MDFKSLKLRKYTGHWRDKRHRGAKYEGDRRAVNRAVTASSDIWAAKWLGACHSSSAAAPRQQKDKKDSEIRFTSGLPEMDRNLPSMAFLCRAIYPTYRYPISALWRVMSLDRLISAILARIGWGQLNRNWSRRCYSDIIFGIMDLCICTHTVNYYRNILIMIQA